MTQQQLDAKIRRTWNSVCAAYPEALTPFVSRETARRCHVNIPRVYDGLFGPVGYTRDKVREISGS